ncbi:AAA family ATPase [Mesoflavibacter sp. CH_XMU1404-2]|uniref:ATP-dependent nuclease n=1 Tax=Mesoflavibacter sp. CH_XMU1404-2 TaxID=3107766 RepID=UPI00300A510C|tara:strand:- start:6 stop:1733 length:1728 start_codon:yes stop_codon:yes gene_type:complete
MKLQELNIQGYKNLKDAAKVSFDFTNCTNYTALIGLNGSGKSNILEAVSLIFSSLYHNTATDFSYAISYTFEDSLVTVNNGVMSVQQNGSEEVTAVAKSAHNKYLPTNVIASYSGEELRMWENIYIESYSDFFKDIKKQTSFVPKLLYINKFSWEFALIALLSSDAPIIKSFIKDILKIGENVEVQFTIEEKNYGLYEDNEALSLIKRLVSLQKESANNYIPIQTISTLELGQQNNKDLTQKLFYYLFITGMPVKGEKIKADKIIRKTDIKFNNIDVKKLSEGEKKLILIYTITHLLADNKTLILLDEPDAHIHIERKKDIIDIIDKEDCFTLFTTHSPKILNCIDENNIKLIKNTKETGVEVLKLDRINALSEITNGEFSIIDATLALSTSKDILLVEGTNDYNYIMQAIEKLSPDYDAYDFHIINCGGADNVPAVVEQSLLSILKDSQLCLCTFDYDGQGRRNYDKIVEIATREGKTNLKAMYHTKLDGTPHINNEDFYMEDYFPVDAYKTDIINTINGKTSFKQLEEYQKPKSIIQKKYETFDSSKYENFRVILDETLKIKREFHNPPVPTA